MDVGTGCGGAMGETWEMEVSVCEGGGWGVVVSEVVVESGQVGRV